MVNNIVHTNYSVKKPIKFSNTSVPCISHIATVIKSTILQLLNDSIKKIEKKLKQYFDSACVRWENQWRTSKIKKIQPKIINSNSNKNQIKIRFYIWVLRKSSWLYVKKIYAVWHTTHIHWSETVLFSIRILLKI